jgi:hypothetical protein
VEMSPERPLASSQASEAWLRNDRLEQCGNELAQ